MTKKNTKKENNPVASSVTLCGFMDTVEGLSSFELIF